MFPLLLIAFVVVPIVELAVIMRVGAWLGVLPTVAILVADSVLGAVLVKREGRRAWSAFRRALEQMRWPGDEVVQGALVLIGGALLLTPGFVTDVVGLLALLPPSRALASRLIRARVASGVVGPASSGLRHRPPRDDVDVEVVSIDRDGPDGPPVDDSK